MTASENRCVDGGALVGTEVAVGRGPEERQTQPYQWVGCSRIFCEGCRAWVRHIDGFRIVDYHAKADLAVLHDRADAAASPLLYAEARHRTYLCRCRWYDTVNVKPIDMLPFDCWNCAGHPTTFEGHALPTDGNWVGFLRAAAKGAYNSQRDGGPLQWVTRLVVARPELRAAICGAWAELLGDDDDDIREQAMELADGLSWELAEPFLSVIERDYDRLRATRSSVATTRSLLGVAINHVYGLVLNARVPPSLARRFADLTDRNDGWPTSLVLALRGDFDYALQHLLPALAQMTPAEIRSFAFGMVGNGPPSTERGFEVVAQAPATTRDLFAAAVRDLEENDPVADMLREPKKPSHWPELARRLGVAP